MTRGYLLNYMHILLGGLGGWNGTSGNYKVLRHSNESGPGIHKIISGNSSRNKRLKNCFEPTPLAVVMLLFCPFTYDFPPVSPAHPLHKHIFSICCTVVMFDT